MPRSFRKKEKDLFYSERAVVPGPHPLPRPGWFSIKPPGRRPPPSSPPVTARAVRSGRIGGLPATPAQGLEPCAARGHAGKMSVPPADRRAFVAERRAASVHRFDAVHSPDYDEHWGAISPSHAAFVARLASLVRPGGAVLDAACGTGQYWHLLLTRPPGDQG